MDARPKRQYTSGATKQKQKLEKEKEGRRTLEEFGWRATSSLEKESDAVTTTPNESSEHHEGESDDTCDINTRSKESQNVDYLFSFSNPAIVCLAGSASVNDNESVHSEDDNETTTALSKLPSDSADAPPNTDPATWSNLSTLQREKIVSDGPPSNPTSFPRDSSGCPLPVGIFHKTLPNGESVPRDWLVWSQTAQGLYCFPCCLFQGSDNKELSMLTRSDAGIKDNWKKLYDKVDSHQRNTSHLSHYCTWKDLEQSLQKKTGIDSALQKEIETETSKWREILRCILDVILFLSERNLAFRGLSSTIGDPDNGLFLGTLELLSKHNKTLDMHLKQVKFHQDKKSRMQAHYLSWSSQNQFLDACGKLVLNAVVNECRSALYYSIIVDGTPDVSHTEQITFVLRYAHRNDENVWEMKERFLTYKDCEKKKGKENKIDLQNCRGQGYDNGSNMSGILQWCASFNLGGKSLCYVLPV